MADKDILRYRNNNGEFITPITKIIPGSGVQVIELKDLSNTYATGEVQIVVDNSGGGGPGSGFGFVGTPREIAIHEEQDPLTSKITKVFRLENKLKLRDETLTFNNAYVGSLDTSGIEPFTLFFHTVTV